ncbi:MAG: sigma-70 family RNA polymerase sigma factor [Planctomycetaceae bacterium]|nr:sigma-70 family RNA polymerase sigma factor [Planctomycetaceae bacterium]
MNEFPDTRNSLIARVQEQGDGASWAEFLAIYQPVVLRMARRRGFQEADALDVVQQVFFSVSRSIGNWQSGDDMPPFRAWLSTIARNAITQTLTRRKPDIATGSSEVSDMLLEWPDREATTAELEREAKAGIFRWVATQVREEFSADTWAAFWRTAIDGDSVAEVSQSLGRSAGAIYVARFRVLARLKERAQELAQQWDLIAPESQS